MCLALESHHGDDCDLLDEEMVWMLCGCCVGVGGWCCETPRPTEPDGFRCQARNAAEGSQPYVGNVWRSDGSEIEQQKGKKNTRFCMALPYGLEMTMIRQKERKRIRKEKEKE